MEIGQVVKAISMRMWIMKISMSHKQYGQRFKDFALQW